MHLKHKDSIIENHDIHIQTNFYFYEQYDFV